MTGQNRTQAKRTSPAVYLLVALLVVFGLPLLVSNLLEDHSGDARVASLSNLKQIGAALTRYAQDHDGFLPPMQDTTALESALIPAYVSDTQEFVSPLTRTEYQTNPSISRSKMESLNAGGRIVIMYEDRPSRLGKFSPRFGRAVLLADGHVRMISEAQWPAFRPGTRAKPIASKG